MGSDLIQSSAHLLHEADAVLIGAGAGLTAAAGISYTDKAKFAEIFPAWVKRGFSMQYQLMGYRGWTEAEMWGYYTVHLNYVYFQQKTNRLYQALREMIGAKDYFVMTSNVDELFHKNNFDRNQIYSPQGSYGRIQCTVPCTPDSVWDIQPFFDKMTLALDPVEQVLTDPSAIPRCPNCGEPMFINARIDNSFIETPYEPERERLVSWIKRIGDKRLLLIEFGAGYNTPVVIRMPMERIATQLTNASFIRVNWEYADVPLNLQKRAVSVQGDIAAFINGVTQQRTLTEN